MMDLAATRDSYDALAAHHADVISSGLDDLPLERALLSTFADLVLAGGNKHVVDAGCGLGASTTGVRNCSGRRSRSAGTGSNRTK